jgi:hypothetical protein
MVLTIVFIINVFVSVPLSFIHMCLSYILLSKLGFIATILGFQKKLRNKVQDIRYQNLIGKVDMSD